MTIIYMCQRCSQLPPPPPIFSLEPPPNILSIDVRCSSRLLSSSSSIQPKKLTSSSSLLAVSLALGVVIVLLISTGTIFLIKNRMIKRRQRERQRKYDDSSSSVKFNAHNHHQNWTTFMPLLSESCSSDQTLSTPPSEYPCGVIDPFTTNNVHHEYEQINYDNSSQYYCLVYCRQCANYHQTNPIRPCYQHQCTCQLPNDNHLFELQPILSRTEDDLNHPPPF